MITTTTPNIEGKQITAYLGIVSGEAVLGADFFKDFLAGLTDFFGGRSGAYESSLQEARQTALDEMMEMAKKLGANAVVGVDVDYESISRADSSLLMVTCNGTAVIAV